MNSLRKQALEYRFRNLNKMQQEAVFQTKGPVLILAGAGSGKTTVLINRIQYMVQFGNAYKSNLPLSAEEEKILHSYINGAETDISEIASILADNPIRPWNILAITFTNKAAGELKHRLTSTLGEEIASEIQASTFHSLCMRILRRNIDRIGYDSNFTIYDTDDSIRVIKDGMKSANIDEKMFKPRSVLAAISSAKDSMMSPKDMLKATVNDYRGNCIARVYEYYQNTLKNANALDFDDIIVLTVELLKKSSEVLDYYQNRYKYIMVDEYQDTNQTQYLLVSMLAQAHQNLCVVGDDDQSIYKFRGATIENILSFENQFDGAKVIRLEQNYRSSQNILTAANNLISHNTARKGKNLWTDAGEGRKISLVNVNDDMDEARFIADSIMSHVEGGGRWNDCAVLYRMNAQSASIERALTQRAIPYRMVGGLRFYERKEIKDMVAYLSVINNTADDLRLNRIVNEPKRGIGAATMDSASEIAYMMNESLFTVLSKSNEYAPLSKKSSTLKEFSGMMQSLIDDKDNFPLGEFIDIVLERTGYMKSLEAEGREGIARIENVMELKNNIVQYSENAPEPSLSGFLEEIALYTDLDNYDSASDAVVLMTIHSAKGLEFPNVFIAGMEEGVFPGRNAQLFPEEIEEERRLAYVAITRAKHNLVITYAQRRMIFGQTSYSRPSRFISELPKEVVELDSHTFDAKTAQGTGYVKKPTVSTSGKSIGVGTTSKPAPSSGGATNFGTGDRVMHKVFGEGTVLSSKPMGGDTLLEIDFDKAGNKKVMANFARLTKV